MIFHMECLQCLDTGDWVETADGDQCKWVGYSLRYAAVDNPKNYKC